MYNINEEMMETICGLLEDYRDSLKSDILFPMDIEELNSKSCDIDAITKVLMETGFEL